MRKFECQSCGLVQEALADAVGHKCPSNRSKWTTFKQVAGPSVQARAKSDSRGVNKRLVVTK
jgi:hypothetical protein